MVDPWIHGTANPVNSDFGDYTFPNAAVFTGGECGTAETVESVPEIRTKTTDSTC
jgi:hypothetical protein